jgi:hypothetical protein
VNLPPPWETASAPKPKATAIGPDASRTAVPRGIEDIIPPFCISEG